MTFDLKSLNNPDNKKVDFLITTVPWTDSTIPLMAPAALKPIIKAAGYSCLAVDLNADILDITQQYKHSDDLINFFFNEQVNNSGTAKYASDLLEEIAKSIISWNPQYVGLSLISYVCQHSAKWIAYFIKNLNPSIKIVLGGPGCLDTFVGDSKFVRFMLNNKLADWHIRGDAEHSLFELLNGNQQYPGINDISWKEMSKDDLSHIPMPDYSDYNLNHYELPALPIVGSRGCVRRCKFCDYIENWKHFQWRDADDVFDEMVEQSKRYGIKLFKFQDSLTNGNMNEFIKLMEKISNYNDHNKEAPFSWAGYYVFRNITDRSAYEWELVKSSGAKLLSVGIENFNEDIRYDIGKKFTNEAIDFHLEHALKYNIRLNLLNIVGYYNETQKHIDFIKHWLDTHIKYRTIIKIQWGAGLGIFPNTYLDRNKEMLGIVLNSDNKPFEWVSSAINSTPKIRAQWVKELTEHSLNLGYSVLDNLDNHYLIEKMLND